MAHAVDLTGLLIGQADSAAQPLGKGEKIIGVASVVGLIIALVYYIFSKRMIRNSVLTILELQN